MNQDPSPYEVSQSGMSPVSVPDLPPAPPTAIPKVFGIIHICYAVLGGLGAFAGVASIAFLKVMAEKAGEDVKEIQPMVDAFDGMAFYMYTDMAIKLVLALSLLVAGIGLLKRKPWSGKLSIGWAVSRIVIAVGMMVWGLQISAEFQEKLGAVQDAQQEQVQQLSQGVGNVLGIVVLCVYPIVTIVFMSKKSVKDALR